MENLDLELNSGDKVRKPLNVERPPGSKSSNT